MAVIGELIVNLKAQTAAFSDGLKKATDDAAGAAGKVGDSAGRMGDAFTGSVGQTRASIKLLTDDLGIHLPKGIMSAMAKMESFQQIATVAFQAGIVIFFAEHVGKAVDAIENGALALGGFGEAAKKAFAEAVKSSDEALIKFKSIAEGQRLIMETNRSLASLDREKQNLGDPRLAGLSKWGNIAVGALSGPGGIGQMAGGLAQRSITDIENQEVHLQDRLIEQLKQLSTLGTKYWKEKEAAAKKDQQTADRAAQLEDQRISERYSYWKQIRDKQAKDEDAYTKQAEKLEKEYEDFQFRGQLDAYKAWDKEQDDANKQAEERLARNTAAVEKSLAQQQAAFVGLGSVAYEFGKQMESVWFAKIRSA